MWKAKQYVYINSTVGFVGLMLQGEQNDSEQLSHVGP